jgi:hypothetical protein
MSQNLLKPVPFNATEVRAEAVASFQLTVFLSRTGRIDKALKVCRAKLQVLACRWILLVATDTLFLGNNGNGAFSRRQAALLETCNTQNGRIFRVVLRHFSSASKLSATLKNAVFGTPAGLPNSLALAGHMLDLPEVAAYYLL